MVLSEKELKIIKENYQEFSKNELIDRFLYFEKW